MGVGRGVGRGGVRREGERVYLSIFKNVNPLTVYNNVCVCVWGGGGGGGGRTRGLGGGRGWFTFFKF